MFCERVRPRAPASHGPPTTPPLLAPETRRRPCLTRQCVSELTGNEGKQVAPVRPMAANGSSSRQNPDYAPALWCV
jgi:hypothetical protein